MLTAQDLTLSFGSRVVLENISCEVRPGEILGLIGANGSGKSTLVKGLAGLLTPSAGDILLEDRPLSSFSALEMARRIAYLPQERVVHWPLSVERVAALGRIPHLGPWEKPGPEDEAAVDRALEQADVLHLKGRGFRTLAGGEKALVLLARALAVEPDMLLADEPVAGLDPHHEIQVMEVLRVLADRGCAVLTVLHHLTLAARFCDRLLLLNRGKIQAAGSPEEVLTPSHLKESFGIHAVFGREGSEFFVLPWARTNPDERPFSGNS